MGRFYVTTPIYYVNDLPHVGHIYTTIVADTVARYRRWVGDEVRFLTGTDEHGQNIERAAAAKGTTPLELADRVVSRYHELWRQIGISHDDFIRTTEDRHRRGVEAIIARLVEAGDLYVDRHEGWYCSPCESFYTEKELVGEKRCPVHDLEAEWRSEENLFFRLSAYGERLLEWYARDPSPVQPATRANEVRSFVESGLRDLSVSRAGLDWGIPFPGHEGQTVYVWLDALTNYISALGYGAAEDELYQRFWEGGDVRLHLVGKDILRFHAVYWPAFLMAAGLPLPTTVWAHGWWLRDEEKVSKSRGNVPRLDELIETFGADSVRHFLLREMAFGRDASFSDEGFVDSFNSLLANDLGNTVSRVAKLASKTYGGRTPPRSCDSNPVREAAEAAVRDYHAAMEELAFHRALEALWRLLSETNLYLTSREPWKLAKDPEQADAVARILWNALEGIRVVAVGLQPFLPEIAPRILEAVGAGAVDVGPDALAWGGTPVDGPLPPTPSLFPRIDKDAFLEATEDPPEAPAQESTMISIDQFFETQLRIATIEAAEPIPKSNKLLKLTVDVGEETSRTVVAGLAQQYAPEELVGKQVALVANLQPAKLMGVESQGMVLAASADGAPILLHPAAAVPPGTTVR